MQVAVDGARLWASLMAMAEVGATPSGGSNRQALSDDDAAGRALFSGWATAAGCQMHTDEIGNLFARYPGSTDASAVLVGSHLDTQPTGGRFDGVYGVLGGLEVVRTLHDQGIVPERPIELAVWTNEEGSRFPRSMLGSAVWSGAVALEEALALRDAEGISIADELSRLGITPSRPAAPFPVWAAFELHIEQGPVLEAEDVEVGVVTGVLGFRWYELTLRGTAAHAGPTPMDQRHDPVRALAAIVSGVYGQIATRGPAARATFAQLSSQPRSPNTVPEVLSCTLDLRHEELSSLEQLEQDVRQLVHAEAAAAGVEITMVEQNRSDPVRFDERCVDLVRTAAAQVGVTHREMVSGAGHDSCNVARVAPAAMVFVPCRDGLSHNEAESISAEEATRGASVLLAAVLAAAVSGEARP